MSKRGKLIVISGFSGVGKGTVIKKMMGEHSGFGFSVSATTRYMREGEVDGVHYFFLTKEEFEQRIAQGGLLEYAQYSGNYYGTPRDYVEKQMDEGINVILDIECQGAFQVKEKMPEAQLIFLIPPSMTVLYNRLKNRGTETMEQIHGRMLQTRRELGVVKDYDVVLVNDKLDRTVEEILSVLDDPAMGREFYDKNLNLVSGFGAELDEILKNIEKAEE